MLFNRNLERKKLFLYLFLDSAFLMGLGISLTGGLANFAFVHGRFDLAGVKLWQSENSTFGISYLGGLLPVCLSVVGLLAMLFYSKLDAERLAIIFCGFAVSTGLLMATQNVTQSFVSRSIILSSVGCIVLLDSFVLTEKPRESQSRILVNALFLYCLVTAEFLLSDIITFPAEVELGTSVAVIGGAGIIDALFVFPLSTLLAYIALAVSVRYV